MNQPQCKCTTQLSSDLRAYAGVSFAQDLLHEAADTLDRNEWVMREAQRNIESLHQAQLASNEALAAANKRTEDTKNAHVKRIRRLRERAHLSPTDQTMLGDRIDAMARSLRKYEESLALLLDVCTARGVYGAAYDKASILLMNSERV